MEPTRAKFKIWDKQLIPELTEVNLGRELNLGLNINNSIEIYQFVFH